jgi:hypothetical protein
MANPTASDAFSDLNFSPEMLRGERVVECFTLTGSSSGVGTTATLTCNYIDSVEAVVGPVSWTASAGVVSATLITDIVSTVVSVMVIGRNLST